MDSQRDTEIDARSRHWGFGQIGPGHWYVLVDSDSGLSTAAETADLDLFDRSFRPHGAAPR